jgi:hypothetical protein
VVVNPRVVGNGTPKGEPERPEERGDEMADRKASLMALVKSKSLREAMANPTETYRERNISSRRYDIVAYRNPQNPEIAEHKYLTAAEANRTRTQLRKEGYYRVDKIEVFSTVKNSRGATSILAFRPKVYEPALVGRIPDPIEAGILKQKDDRNQMRTTNENLRAKNSKSVETRTDTGKVIIYEKMSGKAIFYGEEAFAATYILNNHLNMNEIVIYMPSKTLAKVNAIIKARANGKGK